MRLIRRIFLLICVVATCIVVWAAIHARRDGFSRSWRNAIEQEFASRGYHVELGKLTLGAFRGLVAEDVRFFQDESRKQEIAFINDVFLDVDLSGIFKKQIAINTMDVQNASLSLPLDPARSRRLVVTELSGRIVVTESVIEIVKADAMVSGVAVSLRGTLTRPSEEKEALSSKKSSEEVMLQRRKEAFRLLHEFDTFEFPEGNPRAHVEFRGDWNDLASLSAKFDIEAPAFSKKGNAYRVESLRATASFHGKDNRLVIENCKLRDEKGTLDLTGEWKREGNRLDFSAQSTADLMGLTSLFYHDSRMGEVVFFTPPTINASGHVNLSDLRKTAELGFPGEFIGDLLADRFVTRGQVFTGASVGISVSGRRIYLRNLRLDHKTGVAFLNLKYEPGKGDETILYQTEIKLDPLVFRPFLNDRGRKMIDSWNFGDTSAVYIAAVGQGSDWDFSTWKSQGVFDLRQFRLNGVPFQKLEASYESDGDVQWFRNVSMERKEGKITAEVAENNRAARTWDVKGAVSTVDLIEGARAFNAKLATDLEKYRFAKPPTIRLAGRLDGRREEELAGEPHRNDITLSFSGGGNLELIFLGKPLVFGNPQGEIVVKDREVRLTNLHTKVLGGSLDLDYKAKKAGDPNSPFTMIAHIRDLPLDNLIQHYHEKGDYGGVIDADFTISGQSGKTETFDGSGSIRISEAHLFAIPVLGPLSKLIAQKEERSGNVITEAAANFDLKDGIISTKDMEALSKAFRVKLAGTVSLIDQSVDLEAVVNTREELSQAVLTPLSELLTYSCTGTIWNPVWKPKHISALAQMPATLISELTNIPIEGLKKLGQLGQELFAPLDQLGQKAAAKTAAKSTFRLPWGGQDRKDEKKGESLPRRLLPLPIRPAR